MVGKEAADHLCQPLPLLGDRPVSPMSQLLLDLPEFRAHPVAPCPPLELKSAPAVPAANKGEPEEVKGLRFAEPLPRASDRREAAELDQAGLLRM